MKPHLLPVALVFAVTLAACGQFNRVPPGGSLNVAMAKKAEFLGEPPVPPELAAADQELLEYAPPVEPDLPAMDMTDLPTAGMEIDDPVIYLAKGDMLREQGKDADAIKSYEEAVRADPTFSQAWRNLALAYQDVGNDAKAIEAFRHYKAFVGQ